MNQWTGNGGGPPRIDRQPVRLYDMPGGALADQQLGGFPEGASVEYALDFSADGRRLVAAVDELDAVTGVATRTVATVWDLADPSQPVFRLRTTVNPVLKLSPDAQRLHVALTSGHPQPVRTYDVDSGRLIDSTASPSRDVVTPFAGDLSPDGSTLAITTSSRVHLVDTRTLGAVGPDMNGDPGDHLDRLEFSSDGSLLAASTREGRLLVWDTETGALVHSLAEGGTWAVGFSADDRTLFSGDQAWDLSGDRGLFAVGKASHQAEYDVSSPAPDGHTLVRVQAGRTWFADDRTGRTTPKTRIQPADTYYTWSADSAWLLSWRDGGSLRLWDPATGRQVAHRPLDGAYVVPAFSPDDVHLYVNVVEDQQLLVLDRATLEPVRAPIDLGTRVLEVEAHPDGSVLAIAEDGAVLRVAPTSGVVERVAPAATLRPFTWNVEVSRDGSRLMGPAPTEGDDEIVLLDTATWERLGTGPWDGRFGSYDVSPDGTQLVALDAKKIVVTDAASGDRLASVPVPAVTPDARIAYLPDSSGVFLTGLDGRTWTVSTRPDSWMERACGIAGRNLTRAEWTEHFPTRDYEVTCPQWPAGR